MHSTSAEKPTAGLSSAIMAWIMLFSSRNSVVMDLQYKKALNTSGSVLVICLILAVILGVTLGSYLTWVRHQNVMSIQSHAWHMALAAAEAGVEEAMANINSKFGTSNNLAANGWGGSSGGPYGPVTRTLVSGSSVNGEFSAMIVRDATSGFPIIYSTGYTIVPVIGKRIERSVEAITATMPVFAGAMAALDNITFKGNDIKVDSFDSMDPKHSTTNGMYDPATRKAGGDVASSFGFVDVGNADVNGKVRTGPNGSYSTGPAGFAGDLNWYGPGIQPGWYANDFNADFPDASVPDGFSGIAPMGAGTNTYVLGNFDYTISGNLNMRASDHMLVAGNARLYVTGDVLMQGLSSITITPGASLSIYVAGASATFAKVNIGGNANSFAYFGLPTNKTLTWTGNDQYVGSVYAPQAVFELGGGGANLMDYQGACVARSVSISGKFNFHYDEALQRRGPKSGFRIRAWREF
jgi:hypothetical protein